MKKFIGVMLVLACIFAAVGIGLTVGGVVMGASVEGDGAFAQLRDHYQDVWSYWRDERDSYDDEDEDDGESKIYRFDQVETMNIELKSETVILEAYDEKDVTVTVENDGNGYVKVDCQSKNLSILDTKRNNNRVVTIEYPSDWSFDEINLQASAGSIEIDGTLKVQRLSVEIGGGELTNSGTIITKETDLEIGAGNVEIEDLTVDTLKGECGIGSMSLQMAGAESDYNYELECGIGQITIEDEDYSGLVREKKITNPGADREMKLECGMGEISVEFDD